jgi:LuxR family transcriptional regulator, quorum-sensing system regulator CciR
VSRLDDVNTFIRASRGIGIADDLRSLMESVTREMGFQTYSLFQHLKHFSWSEPRTLALSNFSQGWLTYFIDNAFYAHDPAFAASHRTAVGFTFDEIPSLIDLTPRQREILDAGRKGGVAHGFVVPAHIPGEASGTCTFATESNIELPQQNFPMAQLVGSFAYEAGRKLMLGGATIIRRHEREPPTTRQLECVVLVARGKTDWEIARILGVSEETVADHVNEARRRYDVSRRAELAIHALYHGDLTFSDIIL